VGDTWQWIERLSWIVAIVGIPTLVLGLLTLIRRPSVAVGFFPLRRDRRLLRSVQRPSNEIHVPKNLSNPLTVQLIVANVGRATARDLLVNFTFPTLTLGQLSVPAGAPRAIPHPSLTFPLWAYHIDHIHPGVHHFSEVQIRGTEIASTIAVNFEVSMADATAKRGTCHVIIS
jgi:hypothetical protein